MPRSMIVPLSRAAMTPKRTPPSIQMTKAAIASETETGRRP